MLFVEKFQIMFSILSTSFYFPVTYRHSDFKVIERYSATVLDSKSSTAVQKSTENLMRSTVQNIFINVPILCLNTTVPQDLI